MDNNIIYELAENNPNMTDIDRLVNIYWGLSSILIHSVPGSIIELGCNKGKTSIFLEMIIAYHDQARELHLFDSFEGLPKPSEYDEYLNEGECKADINDVYREFTNRNLRSPKIHKGWFKDTLKPGLFDEIAFAFIDCDFYDSILQSLQFVYPLLSKNAILLVDDYCNLDLNSRAWSQLPGVKKACDKFTADTPEKFSVLIGQGDLAFGLLRKC